MEFRNERLLVKEGHSKRIYKDRNGNFEVELIPSLSSFTHDRYEHFEGTEILRLDFYELAAAKLADAGVETAFVRRTGPRSYLTELCSDPPFETIVKNRAVGSTLRKYPGLFPEGHRFDPPVVKFDYRIDPEDVPISDDYLSAFGLDVEKFRSIALRTNDVLVEWLRPLQLVDFCMVIGVSPSGSYKVTSEISPDCMRLRDEDGASLDKDLFRAGANADQIIGVWSTLVAQLLSGQRSS